MLSVNWYSIFYWISVADGVKSFFDQSSNIFTTSAVILSVITIICTIGRAVQVSQNSSCTPDDDKKDPDIRSWELGRKYATKLLLWSVMLSVASWIGYVFCPSKKDALIIVAGGSVGNFITSDSSAKQIPAEAMVLLRDKIRAEIKDVNGKDVVDTLENKSKDELIKLIRNKNEQK